MDMIDKTELGALQKEIVGLFANIQKIKSELASVKHPHAEEDMLGTVADQINAISEETTVATNEIIAAAEAISEVNQLLSSEIKYGGARQHFEKISANINRIFEACSYHDITGQRLSKIVRTINAVEGTLNSLVVIVGEGGIAALPVYDHKIHGDEGGVRPAGPQRQGEGVSQDDIDKLFD